MIVVSNGLVVLNLLLLLVTNVITSSCPLDEDYGPCTCPYSVDGFAISCNDIPLVEVAAVFRRTTAANLISFSMIIPSSTDEDIVAIPTNLLNNHKVTDHIDMWCPSDLKLRVDPNSFNMSRNSLVRFNMYWCDINGTDFSFLTDFDSLSSLSIKYSPNFDLAEWFSLPPLHNLTHLTISDSWGLNEWTNFPHFVRGLVYLFLGSNEIGNEALDRILLNLSSSPSSSTLTTLDVSNNALTRIPKGLGSFTQLTELILYHQHGEGIPVITKGSLNFSSPLAKLEIWNCGVKTIEPGAFLGDFRSTAIELNINKLTRFEASVFKEVLQQLTENNCTGYVDVSGNPFDCKSDPCHLSWIIHDDPQMLNCTYNAVCSDGTRFEEMDRSGFDHCFITPAPSGVETIKINFRYLLVMACLITMLSDFL